MALTPREVAEAFSRHDFETALPYLADDVAWIIPGAEDIVGDEDVAAACRATAAGLVGVEVRTDRFVVVDGGDRVAIDTRARYLDGGRGSRSEGGDASEGGTAVASCDVYEFEDGALRRLTSYTVEV